MKTLFSILVLILLTASVFAQESSETNPSPRTYKYFVSTNSGLDKTPVGFRIGVLDRMGGYIATRFGKGYKYEENRFNQIKSSEATLFSASAGFAFPITVRHAFKMHSFIGIGYGKWFDRPSKSGQTMGAEFEAGLMFSYNRVMLNVGGNFLTGDGNPAPKDMTLGVGFRF